MADSRDKAQPEETVNQPDDIEVVAHGEDDEELRAGCQINHSNEF